MVTSQVGSTYDACWVYGIGPLLDQDMDSLSHVSLSGGLYADVGPYLLWSCFKV